MKIKTLFCFLLGLILTACATAPEPEPAQPDPGPGTVLLDNPLLDGIFLVPGVDMSRYSRLLVTELNLDDWRPEGVTQSPLPEMNRDDRRFFRDEYVGALVHYLVADGGYELALEPGPDVLRVDASLHQAVRPAARGTGAGDPRDMVVILLNLELYDSSSSQLLATITDRQPLGRADGRGPSRVTEVQIRRAFSQWMSYLRNELDQLTGS